MGDGVNYGYRVQRRRRRPQLSFWWHFLHGGPQVVVASNSNSNSNSTFTHSFLRNGGCAKILFLKDWSFDRDFLLQFFRFGGRGEKEKRKKGKKKKKKLLASWLVFCCTRIYLFIFFLQQETDGIEMMFSPPFLYKKKKKKREKRGKEKKKKIVRREVFGTWVTCEQQRWIVRKAIIENNTPFGRRKILILTLFLKK